MGMVGGGDGAFIGVIHRLAANMDGQIELVCGAFSRDAEKSKKSGRTLFLPQERCYASYQEMFEMEAKLDDETRMDMVAIVTPNATHFPISQMALKHGFHVMCDKPATFSYEEAVALKPLVEKSGLLYGLTHTYTGYPMVKEAKQRVLSNELGAIRKVVVEYPQGWLARKEDEGSKQAAWRLDPKQAGISCCMGDIGVHAANLAEYISGLKITELCADLTSNVEGRVLDDDGTVLLKFDSGARGVLMASQVSVGEENSLKIRIYGEKASLEWSQLEPNTLWKKYPDQPVQMIRAGVGSMSEQALFNMRTPAGHPEGYLEAFANIYHNFALNLQSRLTGNPVLEVVQDIPGIDEALRGMAFIENVVSASESDVKWHPFKI